MIKKGFLLVELVIYVSLFMSFSLVVFHLLGSIIHDLGKSRQVCSLKLKNALAIDVVRRDVLSASMDPAHWDKEDFVFRQQTINQKGRRRVVDIGFAVKKGKLYRSSGVYDFKKKHWVKRFISLVGGSFNTIKVVTNIDKKSRYIGSVSLGCKMYEKKNTYHEYKETVRFRNRVLI